MEWNGSERKQHSGKHRPPRDNHYLQGQTDTTHRAKRWRTPSGSSGSSLRIAHDGPIPPRHRHRRDITHRAEATGQHQLQQQLTHSRRRRRSPTPETPRRQRRRPTRDGLHEERPGARRLQGPSGTPGTTPSTCKNSRKNTPWRRTTRPRCGTPRNAYPQAIDTGKHGEPRARASAPGHEGRPTASPCGPLAARGHRRTDTGSWGCCRDW